MIESETVIDGRYRVLSRIGSGGMADVYLAEDQLLGRQVAVKVLHHHFAEDQEFVERFRREASSAARLSHQNIVGIFDRGEWDGTYYIAMEYVAGRSLKTLVREQGALDPVMAIDIVVQILRAARSAHKRGVIHRDLKPHNVILDEEGRARVTDFGIARAGASDMTLTGSIMGTAQYLSPEQAQGQPVSASSDLYSVGVILYELLTGVVPFDGETAVAIAFKQVSATPAAPSTVNPAIPASLDAIVLRALAKDPAARYADADEFIQVLERERQQLPAVAGVAMTTAYAPARSAGAVAPTAGLFMQPAGAAPEEPGNGAGDANRRKWLWWGLGAAALIAAIVLVIVLVPPRGRVTVPGVVGLSEQAAVTRLRHSGLDPVATQAASTGVASGLVVAQSPALGAVVHSGTRVNVVVSSGPPSKPLIDVKGLSSSEAVSKLRAAGFEPTTSSQASPSVAQGHVVTTEPSAGTEVALGSPVTRCRVQRPRAGARARSQRPAAGDRGSRADGGRADRRHGDPAGIQQAVAWRRAVAVAGRGRLAARRTGGEPGDRPGLEGSDGAERRRPERGAGGSRAGGGRAEPEDGVGGDDRSGAGRAGAAPEPLGRPAGEEGGHGDDHGGNADAVHRRDRFDGNDRAGDHDPLSSPGAATPG